MVIVDLTKKDLDSDYSGLYFGFDRDKNIYKSLVGNLRNGRKLKLNANTRLQMAA